MLATSECAAQTNMVPNPGFELKHSIGQCPSDTTLEIYSPNYWDTVGLGSSDYLIVNTCNFSNGVPINPWGYQNAFEGIAYMHIAVVEDTSETVYREYIQTPLISTLVAGRKYCFSAWVSMSDSSLRAIDNLGAYFSDTFFTTELYGMNIPVIPQVQNLPGRFLNDKKNWMLTSGSFYATGIEKFLLIGNFFDDFHTAWVTVPPCGNNGFWYMLGDLYIDMVSLFDCTDFYYTANAGEDGTVCRGQGVILGTEEASARTYRWSPAAGLSDSAVGMPVASPHQTTTYVLTVIDEYIQQTTDTVTVFVDTTCGTNPVYIANVFSPNGDGSNDVLYAHSQSVREISFKVYNRWGNLLFESKSLDNGWDGKLRGEDCPEGVYFFVAEVTFESGESVVKKGNVTLIR
jgi:gliding motility-associated-like protein